MKPSLGDLRAFVLVGFVGAFRVGELVALDAEDLDVHTEGIVVRVRRAKTDQEGRGRIKPLPLAPERLDLCPVRALQAWQAAVRITSGPLWRGITKGGSVRSGRLTSRAELDALSCSDKTQTLSMTHTGVPPPGAGSVGA